MPMVKEALCYKPGFEAKCKYAFCLVHLQFGNDHEQVLQILYTLLGNGFGPGIMNLVASTGDEMEFS